jgi:hypothetical protein
MGAYRAIISRCARDNPNAIKLQLGFECWRGLQNTGPWRRDLRTLIRLQEFTQRVF